MQTYIQCRLNKNGAMQVSWLPTEFAEAGRYVKLKEHGEWDDGWKVMEAFPGAVRTQEEIVERSQDYKKTRRASDI